MLRLQIHNLGRTQFCMSILHDITSMDSHPLISGPVALSSLMFPAWCWTAEVANWQAHLDWFDNEEPVRFTGGFNIWNMICYGNIIGFHGSQWEYHWIVFFCLVKTMYLCMSLPIKTTDFVDLSSIPSPSQCWETHLPVESLAFLLGDELVIASGGFNQFYRVTIMNASQAIVILYDLNIFQVLKYFMMVKQS